jgi:nucleotide-binding universal stress UspA family protein
MAACFPTTILAVSDGGELGHHAIALAGEVAKATSSQLELLNVTIISRYIYPALMNEQQVQRIKDAAQRRLAADLAFAKAHDITIAASHTGFGQSDELVVDHASRLKVGMVVIANRTGSSVERILLGSDVESVVRHAPCPVLVARTPAAP